LRAVFAAATLRPAALPLLGGVLDFGLDLGFERRAMVFS
jgi:hypothetical protein